LGLREKEVIGNPDGEDLGVDADADADTVDVVVPSETTLR
jgi:hypothetical protein